MTDYGGFTAGYGHEEDGVHIVVQLSKVSKASVHCQYHDTEVEYEEGLTGVDWLDTEVGSCIGMQREAHRLADLVNDGEMSDETCQERTEQEDESCRESWWLRLVIAYPTPVVSDPSQESAEASSASSASSSQHSSA
jgi:hypothetical protein